MDFSKYYDERKLKKEIKRNSREIIAYLSETLGERTLRDYDMLNKARYYIIDSLSDLGYAVSEETYKVRRKEVSNIIVDIPGYGEPEKIILIGAHYDTVEDSPGADDNASAIAALLEIARMIKGKQFKKTLRLVALTLEEPPFFKTADMGSMRYAKSCKKDRDNIELAIIFDMLGFADKRIIQQYPVSGMGKMYPSRGDFLTVVSFPSCSESVFLWKKIYNKQARHKIYDVIGPASIPGLDHSDHTSFILNGYQSLMLTDTAYYRNKHYHMSTDTMKTLNFKFLTENIFNICRTVEVILNN